jgi:hypothetical protein
MSSRLHDHLVHEHGRSGREIDGLPLADLHRFEHVEQALGLITLAHRHGRAAPVGDQARSRPFPR